MILKLIASNAKPAAEGFGEAVVWFLMVVGTLALIYAVLVILDRKYKKNSGNNDKTETSAAPANKSFQKVLSEEIERSKDRDGDRRV